MHHEVLVESPPMFPPTFLYTMSWEDPDVDMKVLQISKDDVCLTLTSGGCNSLNLMLHGAKEVRWAPGTAYEQCCARWIHCCFALVLGSVVEKNKEVCSL